eukprot:1246567-Pyramimonas_sp.AAC.1
MRQIVVCSVARAVTTWKHEVPTREDIFVTNNAEYAIRSSRVSARRYAINARGVWSRGASRDKGIH